MKKTKLSPHDRFFKRTLSDLKVARHFFKRHLPETIKNVTDFGSLQVQKDSFIDEQLRLSTSDMLFSVKLAEKTGFFYVVVEHQSTPDRQMPLRMLKYTLQIIEKHMLKNGDLGKHRNKTPLPVVVPLLVYNGKPTPYPYSVDIFDLFDDPSDIARATFAQPLNLIDLGQIPDEDIRQNIWTGILEGFLKHIYDRDILNAIEKYHDVLVAIDGLPNGVYHIESLLNYLASAAETRHADKVINTLKTGTSNLMEKKIMTLGEQLKAKGKAEGRAEGKVEGRAEGKVEGRAEVAKNLASMGLSIEQIIEATQLPEEDVKKITLH